MKRGERELSPFLFAVVGDFSFLIGLWAELFGDGASRRS